MKSINLWNAAIGKSLININTNEEDITEELDALLDMPVEKAFKELLKQLPHEMRKMRFGTLLDLYINFDESSFEEEEEEDEDPD